ncbi:hypothetical protein [uncultured Dokdonia sp.]|uniref:hypothetical protein n=1 Tax=uncultured Dokdonia sp. TaxID=575653 RepID=UPI0026173E18|nr:hypothetical protein [uncultured Dokdonia sp.]
MSAIFPLFIFSSVMPDAAIQALPNSGPYHINPTTKEEAAAASKASQLTSKSSINSIVFLVSYELKV